MAIITMPKPNLRYKHHSEKWHHLRLDGGHNTLCSIGQTLVEAGFEVEVKLWTKWKEVKQPCNTHKAF
jgi:hypothetical protein